MFRNAYEITKLKEITLETKNGEMISTNSFKGKTTIIDFWSTSCGICYNKFPEFEKLHKMYEQDTNIIFYSIHIPTKYDSIEKSKKLLDEFNYSFNKLYSLNPEDITNFDISFFPILIIVNKDLEIIYRGGLNTKWYEVVYNARQIIDKQLEP